MTKQIRTRALWLALGLTLGGGTLALAGVGPVHDPPGPPETKPPVTKPAKPDTPPGRAHGDGEGGARPENHGFFVSKAAHCEDVSTEGFSFTAPENCDTNGKSHGAYVSSVARSDVGKPDKPD